MDKLVTEGGQAFRIRRESRWGGFLLELVKVLFLFSMPVEVLIYAMSSWTGDLSYMYAMIALLLVPVYSIFVRRLVKNFFLFSLLQLALIGVIFLYPDVPSRICAGGIVGVDLLYIYIRKYSGENETMSSAALFTSFGLALVMYLLAPQLCETASRTPIIVFFLIQVTVYMVYYHQVNLRSTLYVNAEEISQSEKKINRLNNKIIFVYILVLLAFIGLGVVLRMDLVFTAIGQGLFLLLKLLVRLIFRGDGSSTSDVVEETVEETSSSDGLMSGEYTTWQIWLILEKVMFVICFSLVIVLIVYLCYHFYQQFKQDHVEENTYGGVEETTIFIEKVKPKKTGPTLAERISPSNEMRIRRLFRKKVLKYRGQQMKVRPSETAQEIRASITKEDLTTLTGLYEKVRYADEKITKEELNQVL